jgi:uncharacterized protein
MKRLGAEKVGVIVDEFGRDELLRRVSNPFWFQSLGCALGYDWHSSGVTTVLTAVLREVLNPRVTGIAVCGGNGKLSKRSPNEIRQYATLFTLSSEQTERLVYASRLTAKVDNAAIQADYPLYHHSFFMTNEGKWSVVQQQGMSNSDKTARRCHWLSEHVTNFIDDPHEAIVGNKARQLVLNMTSQTSEDSRNVSLDLAKEGARRVKTDLMSLRSESQKARTEWIPELRGKNHLSPVLRMPRRINWDAITRAYEFQPRNHGQLLSTEGMGPPVLSEL